jgi:hypothetical protein
MYQDRKGDAAMEDLDAIFGGIFAMSVVTIIVVIFYWAILVCLGIICGVIVFALILINLHKENHYPNTLTAAPTKEIANKKLSL